MSDTRLVRAKYRRLVGGLTLQTRELLAKGAWYWSNEGPAGIDPPFAAMMNFAADANPGRELSRVAQSLRADEPVAVLDLTRALLLTEIGSVSAVMGPQDWENVFGDPGPDLLQVLRDAQDELQHAGVPASGGNPFGRNPFFD